MSNKTSEKTKKTKTKSISREKIQGNITLFLQDPLSSQKIPVEDVEKYLKDKNSILIYLDDEPMPYCMKRTYFTNLLYDDYDYKCNNKGEDTCIKNTSKSKEKIDENDIYYNLSKLFLNRETENVKINPPNIVVPKKQIDSIQNMNSTNIFRLYSTNQLVKTFPMMDYKLIELLEKHVKELLKKNEKRNDKEIDDTEIIEESIYNISCYTSSYYKNINKYLIRLTDYTASNSKKFTFDKILKYITNIFFSNTPSSTTKSIDKLLHKPNYELKEIIHYMDYYFQKEGYKENNEKKLYRVSHYYPYLNKVGDKMVIENYISTTDSEDHIMQMNAPLYEIILSPNIPYINTYKGKIMEHTQFLNEREIILPRNLIAELVKIDDEADLWGNFGHTIKLTPMYPTQFDVLEKKCSDHNVYNFEKYNNHSPLFTGGNIYKIYNKYRKTRKNKDKNE